MAAYSFKSSGRLAEEVNKNINLLRPTFKPIPIGIKTPLQLGDLHEGFLKMTYDIREEIADNLKNLLLTNWGERVGLFDFGANLKPICTEFVTQEDFDTAAISRIKSAVEKWMPQIQLEDFTSESDRTENRNTAVRKITVTYKIPAVDDLKRAVQVILRVF